MSKPELVVGQRDEKGRKFMGWRAKWAFPPRVPFYLTDQLYWVSTKDRSDIWSTRRLALDSVDRYFRLGDAMDGGKIVLVRVWRKEPPARALLREFVRMYASLGGWGDLRRLFDRARVLFERDG